MQRQLIHKLPALFLFPVLSLTLLRSLTLHLRVMLTCYSVFFYVANESHFCFCCPSPAAARHRAMRQRTVSLCRRNSETYSLTGADINRSHISLNQLTTLSRRQMSLTQSEPDSDKDTPAAPHPGKLHSEVRTSFVCVQRNMKRMQKAATKCAQNSGY